VEDGKLAPKDALALNYLANPVEYYYAGTTEFAQAIRAKAGPDPEIISELVAQFSERQSRHSDGQHSWSPCHICWRSAGPTSEAANTFLPSAGAMPACMTCSMSAENDHGIPDARRRKQADTIIRKTGKRLLALLQRPIPRMQPHLYRP